MSPSISKSTHSVVMLPVAVVTISFRETGINVMESDKSFEVCLDTSSQTVSRVIDVAVTALDGTAVGMNIHAMLTCMIIKTGHIFLFQVVLIMTL